MLDLYFTQHPPTNENDYKAKLIAKAEFIRQLKQALQQAVQQEINITTKNPLSSSVQDSENLMAYTHSFFSKDLFAAIQLLTLKQQVSFTQILIDYFSMDEGRELFLQAAYHLEIIKNAMFKITHQRENVCNSITSFLYKRLSEWHPSASVNSTMLDDSFIRDKNEFIRGLVKSALRLNHEFELYAYNLSAKEIDHLIKYYQQVLKDEMQYTEHQTELDIACNETY